MARPVESELDDMRTEPFGATANPDTSQHLASTQELESLRAVVASIGGETELRPLLSRILRHACTLIGADDGAIGLVMGDGSVVRTEAIHQMPPSELGSSVRRGEGLNGEVLRTGSAIRVPRYGDLPSPAAVDPVLLEHAVVGVPIRRNDRMIGVFGLGRSPTRDALGLARPRPFSASDVAALEVFATHAGVAVENARRLNREQHRAERFALIARLAQLIMSNLEPDDLLQHAADSVHMLLGYENVAIPLLDADGTTLVLRAFGGAYKHAVGGEHRIPIDRGLMGAACRDRRPVLVNDVSADPRYLPTPGIEGIVAELAVPILHGDRVVGVLNVESSEPFDQEDADDLHVVADQLAVALENARLYLAAQGAAALEERHRLARELHDAVTQQLFSALLVAQTVGPAFARGVNDGEARVHALLDVQRSALREMRALVMELRPLSGAQELAPFGVTRVRHDGLIATIREHVLSAAFAALRVSIEDGGYQPQPSAREEALFRIVLESLHNAVKHARATQVTVRLATRRGEVTLAIQDDGIGFAPSAARSPMSAGGLGLISMRERAAENGGALRVDSAPGRGTLIEVVLPLNADGTP